METNSSSDSITETVDAESARHLRPHGLLIGFKERRRRGEPNKHKPRSFWKQLIRPSKTATTPFFREPKKTVSNKIKDSWKMYSGACLGWLRSQKWRAEAGTFPPIPSHSPLGKKAGLMLLLLIVQQAIDPHFFLASSLPHTSLPSAYELWWSVQNTSWKKVA